MPIERYQRPLNEQERTRLERELAFSTPEAVSVRFRKEKSKALFGLILVGLAHLILTYALAKLDIPALLAFGGLVIVLFIVYGLAYENYQRVSRSYHPTQVQSNYEELLSEWENDRRYGCRVSTQGCIALWSLDEDVCWLFQTDANQVLLLDRYHFYWIKGDYPPTQFEIDDALENLDPLVRALSELCVPRAQLVLEGYVPAFTAIPVLSLPVTPEVEALRALNDGDIFALSLAELLDNPLALVTARTGNLWERT